MSEFKRFTRSQHVIEALESNIPILAGLPYELTEGEVRFPLATWNSLSVAQKTLVGSILNQEGYAEVTE